MQWINLPIKNMKYPRSRKTAKAYADYLSSLHGKKYYPIKRTAKIKNKFVLNFAAESEEFLDEYLTNGWKLVD